MNPDFTTLASLPNYLSNIFINQGPLQEKAQKESAPKRKKGHQKKNHKPKIHTNKDQKSKLKLKCDAG